jgi:hypothetical protein
MSLFLSVDPLVESTMGPYGYCYQNPLKFINPTGMSEEGTNDWIEEDGKIYWDNEVTSSSNAKPEQTYIGKKDTDVLDYLGINRDYKISQTKYV